MMIKHHRVFVLSDSRFSSHRHEVFFSSLSRSRHRKATRSGGRSGGAVVEENSEANGVKLCDAEKFSLLTQNEKSLSSLIDEGSQQALAGRTAGLVDIRRNDESVP
jgi:hypothetical protein